MNNKEENSWEFCHDFVQEFGLSSVVFLGAVYTYCRFFHLPLILHVFVSTPCFPIRIGAKVCAEISLPTKIYAKIEIIPPSIMVFLNHSIFISFCVNRSPFLLPRTSNSIRFLPVKSRSAHAPHIKDWILFISVSFHLYFQRDISFKIFSHLKPKAQSSYDRGRKKITSFITCLSVIFPLQNPHLAMKSMRTSKQ